MPSPKSTMMFVLGGLSVAFLGAAGKDGWELTKDVAKSYFQNQQTPSYVESIDYSTPIDYSQPNDFQPYKGGYDPYKGGYDPYKGGYDPTIAQTKKR